MIHVALSTAIITAFVLLGASAATLNEKECRCGSASESCWPSPDAWNALNQSVHGRLSTPSSPVDPCLNGGGINDPDACHDALEKFGKDPFWLQTLAGGTESTGTLKFVSIDICI